MRLDFSDTKSSEIIQTKFGFRSLKNEEKVKICRESRKVGFFVLKFSQHVRKNLPRFSPQYHSS